MSRFQLSDPKINEKIRLCDIDMWYSIVPANERARERILSHNKEMNDMFGEQGLNVFLKDEVLGLVTYSFRGGRVISLPMDPHDSMRDATQRG